MRGGGNRWRGGSFIISLLIKEGAFKIFLSKQFIIRIIIYYILIFIIDIKYIFKYYLYVY